MRILLIGEYSGVHSNLAHGLRQLGHEVVVASDGDGWKNYKRDLEYAFNESKWSRIKHLLEVLLGKFKGYDVVQVINYQMLVLSSNDTFNNLFFNQILKGNKKFFLGAFGDDYFWVKSCQQNQYKYSQFNHLSDAVSCIDKIHINKLGKLTNTMMADKADGIIAGLYEYYHAYDLAGYSEKLTYIPFPIIIEAHPYQKNIVNPDEKIKIFMGIQKHRATWKGSDVLLQCLNELVANNPDKVELFVAENVPFHEYKKMYSNCNVLVDQLFSYSPAMNALNAMAQGKILVGGGESECYELYNETESFPIINVTPDVEQIKKALINLINQKDNFEQLGKASHDFVVKHHESVNVAKIYLEFWQKGPGNETN